MSLRQSEGLEIGQASPRSISTGIGDHAGPLQVVRNEDNNPRRTMVRDKKQDLSHGELSEMNVNEGLNHRHGWGRLHYY